MVFAYAYDMTTNASLINNGIAAILAKNNVHVSVSIDGLPSGNDAIRKTKNKTDSSFIEIEKGINCLIDNGVNVDFSSVLSSKNYNQYDESFIDYAKSKGVTSIVVILSFMDDSLKPQAVATPEEISEKLFRLYVYGKNHGILVNGYWYNPIARLLSTEVNDKHNTYLEFHDTCTATGFQLNVEPSGDIFACRATSLRLGEINDFDSVFSRPEYSWTVMRTYNNVKACAGCEIEGFCQGVCIGHVEQKYNNDIYNIDPDYCNVYRSITSKILFHALAKQRER
ncbi:MAG: SPASM domain-containing protein [Candidatus Thiosymbion ectosymbiont of Robbea hypermnestra]|nr:SPASM domain-containing protein [Candidatus Thiosymbion ectosymbiont of Robbea hypermnestra]